MSFCLYIFNYIDSHKSKVTTGEGLGKQNTLHFATILKAMFLKVSTTLPQISGDDIFQNHTNFLVWLPIPPSSHKLLFARLIRVYIKYTVIILNSIWVWIKGNYVHLQNVISFCWLLLSERGWLLLAGRGWLLFIGRDWLLLSGRGWLLLSGHGWLLLVVHDQLLLSRHGWLLLNGHGWLLLVGHDWLLLSGHGWLLLSGHGWLLLNGHGWLL